MIDVPGLSISQGFGMPFCSKHKVAAILHIQISAFRKSGGSMVSWLIFDKVSLKNWQATLMLLVSSTDDVG